MTGRVRRMRRRAFRIRLRKQRRPVRASDARHRVGLEDFGVDPVGPLSSKLDLDSPREDLGAESTMDAPLVKPRTLESDPSRLRHQIEDMGPAESGEAAMIP